MEMDVDPLSCAMHCKDADQSGRKSCVSDFGDWSNLSRDVSNNREELLSGRHSCRPAFDYYSYQNSDCDERLQRRRRNSATVPECEEESSTFVSLVYRNHFFKTFL